MIQIDNWWKSKFKKYNLRLIYIGTLALIIHNVLIKIIISPYNIESRITVRSIMLLIIMYVSIILTENIFYYLGSLIERVIKPKDIDKFRKRLFIIGCWISWIILFLPALSILIFPELYRLDID